MNLKNKTIKFLIATINLGFLILSAFTSQALAQGNVTTQVVGVSTTEYSVLSPTNYVLGGEYYGNTGKKPFTTYFEYKRNNSDLTVNPEETIKIVRKSDVSESGFFYSSPSLQLSSTYFFRSVGYFNDAPEQKFYGSVLSFRTEAPFIGNIPFTEDFGDGTQAGMVKPYSFSTCPSTKVYFLPTDSCVVEPTCTPPQILTKYTNTCVDPNSPEPTTMTPPPSTPATKVTPTAPQGNPPVLIDNPPLPATTPSSPLITDKANDESSGLIPCTNDCDFNKFLDLINNVVRFLLFKMVVPIAAVMFAYAGFELVTAGGESSHARDKAKKIFTNAVIGLVIAVAAFLIVKTILGILGYNGSWIGF